MHMYVHICIYKYVLNIYRYIYMNICGICIAIHTIYIKYILWRIYIYVPSIMLTP